MKIRKLAYTIGYIHILTFRENYKTIIAPYFSYQPLEYGIDNEGTIHETIRLVFRESGFILQFNKEAAILVYEGDVAIVKKQNPIIDIFFDITEKLKKTDGFVKITNNSMVIDFVEITEKSQYDSLLEKNNYFSTPFKNIEEFGLVLEFEKEAKKCKFQFGNYNKKDIEKLNLMPLGVDYNKDLLENVGKISQVTIREDTSLPNFSKFKILISDAENICNEFLAI